MDDCVWIVDNIHQGLHGIFSTEGKAKEYVESKINNSYGSCHSTDSWDIYRHILNIPHHAAWKIGHYIACPEYGYPESEALFMSEEEYDLSK